MQNNVLCCNRGIYLNIFRFSFIPHALKNKCISSPGKFQFKFAIEVGSSSIRKFLNENR